MSSPKPHRRLAVAWRAVPVMLALLTAAGCASASSTASATGTAKSGTSGMNMGSSSSASASASASGMSGMNMGSSAGVSAGGIKPVPTQVLGTATWQGMKITAKAMTAVPFIVYDGTTEKTVKPSPNASFHLMVFLQDAQTSVVIPYAGVWATITRQSGTDFDERLWPMISRYMGPHYGNDVSLPGSGTYTMSLLVSPPVSARHVEYQNVWLKPHRVTFTFQWKQPS